MGWFDWLFGSDDDPEPDRNSEVFKPNVGEHEHSYKFEKFVLRDEVINGVLRKDVRYAMYVCRKCNSHYLESRP